MWIRERGKAHRRPKTVARLPSRQTRTHTQNMRMLISGFTWPVHFNCQWHCGLAFVTCATITHDARVGFSLACSLALCTVYMLVWRRRLVEFGPMMMRRFVLNIDTLVCLDWPHSRFLFFGHRTNANANCRQTVR